MPSLVKGSTIKGFYLSTDLQLLNKTNIYQLTQYQVTSSTQFILNQISKNELQNALKFPLASNPRTFKLGKTWQQSLSSKQEIVEAGLNYFKNMPF